MAAKLRGYKIASLILVLTFSTIILSSSVAASSLTATQTIASYGQITASTSANTLSVNGTHIINGLGQTIYLRGLTRSGLELPVGSSGMSQADVDSGNYGSLITENDFAVMASMGADCVRVSFGWGWLEPQIGVYNMTYFARLEQVISWAESNNLYVILDLHNDALQYPYVASWITDPGFFTNATQQQSFMDLWTWLSQQFMNNPRVLYDLINEPYSPALSTEIGWNEMCSQIYPALFNSTGLYARTIQAIRANGDDKICIVEGAAGDNWDVVGTDGVTYPIKLSDSNVLYSIHLYYPSNSGDDMSWYNYVVNYAYQFSVDNNVPIFVGEWGIPWMNTNLSVTEQTYWTQDHCQTYANLGFNWCYWSFKEDEYSIYYSDEWSGIFNDTLRPMASVLSQYLPNTTPSTYSSITAENSTIVGASSTFSVTVNDPASLNPDGQYKFGTNNTGSWVWASTVNFTSTPQTVFTSVTLDSVVGDVVAYEWDFTDNAGNNYSTGIQTLTITST